MRQRAELLKIGLTYYCPKDNEEKTVSIEPSAQGLHAEVESCSHCGYAESCTLNLACECGSTHFLYLLSRLNS
jgi:hypothetical protein